MRFYPPLQAVTNVDISCSVGYHPSVIDQRCLVPFFVGYRQPLPLSFNILINIQLMAERGRLLLLSSLPTDLHFNIRQNGTALQMRYHFYMQTTIFLQKAEIPQKTSSAGLFVRIYFFAVSLLNCAKQFMAVQTVLLQ